METDFLVIGSGISGLNFALRAAQYGDVVLATKSQLEESNTLYAQAGIAAALGRDDSTLLHLHDTLKAGDGISNKEIAKIVTNDAPKRIRDLQAIGIGFDSDKKGLSLARKAAHSRSRIAHISDMTGKVIEKTLADKVRSSGNIRILEYNMAFRLITKKGKCVGCKLLDLKDNNVHAVFSKKTVLATGGLGRLYARTTNSEIATGDGIAMAFRAGAVLEDMEFVQFHPTMLHNSSPSFLISETVRGDGGLLKNKRGKSYMKKYHRDGDLAPRSIVARFSLVEMKKTNSKNVYLDITHHSGKYLKKRFPYIYKECLKQGIDISMDMIPVSPAAHYLCGGIKTDEYGMTNIRNLYAIGECACTQLHGADKLASNSMAECLVFSSRLISRLKSEIRKERLTKIKIKDTPISPDKNSKIPKLKKHLQEIMDKHVGIIRNKKGLNTALEKIRKISKKFEAIKIDGMNKEIAELDNMLLLAEIIILCSLRRKESRGAHFMQDYSERYDNIWRKHLSIDKEYYRQHEMNDL